MTSQPWIPGQAKAYLPTRYNLQWSHDLPAMDTTGSIVVLTTMHLLQWSHDLPAMDTRI